MTLRLTSRNDGTTGSTKATLPSPYTFSNPDEAEALARRAARFQRPSEAGSSSSATATATLGGHSLGEGGIGRWFQDDVGETGSSGFGMVPGQVGKKKMKGKAGLGYAGEDVMEVDPVSRFGGL
jgi:hypothetical protein